MSRIQQHIYHVEPSRFPLDFHERLEKFVQAAGLSWRGLARRLRVSVRCVWRWKAGTKPDSGHLVALFNLAAEVGLLHILLPAVGEPPQTVEPRAACLDQLGLKPAHRQSLSLREDESET